MWCLCDCDVAAKRPCFVDARMKLAGMRSRPMGRIIEVMPNQKAIAVR